MLACSTRNTTLRSESAGGQVIYRISEEQAFTVALAAFAEVLPNQSLFDIGEPRRGYHLTWRFGLDTYSQRVLVVPATGNDPAGKEVRGYWFDVSGSGTAIISGAGKNRELHRRLQEALDATGTATVVTNLREGRYETDGSAYRAQGRDAREAASRSRAPAAGAGVADQLRELKALHDQGLITKEEYDAKRRQLLDRI
jgi:hypothetical protein